MSEILPDTAVAAEEQERQERVYQSAYSLYHGSPDWVTFFREVLGLRGVVRRCYSSRETLEAFEKTDVYAEIQQMLGQLRRQANGAPIPHEKVITVRLPRAVHDALKAEAYERHTSMNKLCISKLLQFIDEELVPSDFRERGDPEADV